MQPFQIVLLLFVTHIIEVPFQYCQEIIVVTLTEKAESLTAVSVSDLITSALYSAVIKIINESDNFMTIVITNEFEK